MGVIYDVIIGENKVMGPASGFFLGLPTIIIIMKKKQEVADRREGAFLRRWIN